MMVKSGFNINLARILNPTAIFCYDREEYYAALYRADRGDDEGLLQWTAYMLKGLLRELEKTDKLADYDYLKKEILAPTIEFSLEKNLLNDTEAKILRLVIEKREVANADIKAIIPGKDISDISRMIRSLVEKNYLVPTEKNKRKYSINFRDNKLIRGVIHSLDKAGFLPGSLGGSI
jgi:Fic family protein